MSDENFSSNAPKGKFRIVGFKNGYDWIEGDFDTLKEAINHIRKNVSGRKMYVYDDTGKRLYEAGSFRQ